MGLYLGDYEEDSTVYFCWDTNSKRGASITRATDGAIKVYKDDSTTESTAGITDTEDFDSVTGVHNCKIDLSSDAFYAVGHDYSVVLAGAVIDGETVNSVLATFSIENRFMRGTDSAALASVCTEARLAELAAANLPADVDTLKGYCDKIDDATDGLTAIKGEVEGLAGEAMRGTDNAALASALTTHDGKLDTVDGIVDAILVDTGTTLDGKLDVIDDFLDTEIAAILADTNELQTDDVPGLIAALNDLSAAEVNAECDTAFTDYDPPTKAELDAALAGLNDVSAAEVNAEVDTALADYDPPTKAELDTAESNIRGADSDTLKTLSDEIDAVPTASEIQSEMEENGASILDTLQDRLTAGRAGYLDELAAANIPADLNNILADTNELQGLISDSKLAVQVKGMDADVLTASALKADAIDEILNEEVDNDGTAISLRGAIKLILSVLTAKSSGGGTTTLTFRDINDTKNRLVVTVDENGNRTAVGTRDAA